MLLAMLGDGTRRGWRQLVLNPFAFDPGSSELRGTGYDYLGAPATSLGDAWRLRRWLGAALADFRPDVVHAHLFHALALVASTPTAGVPRVVTHHHGSLFTRQGPRWKAAVDAIATRRFDVVVAVSDEVREHLLLRYRIPAGRIRVVHNGWQGQPLPHRTSTRGTVIVTVAGLRPEKGHDILLDAFARLHAVRPDTRLVLVGDGPLAPDLAAKATALGLTGAVRMTGAVADVWSMLASADVFALPSRYESLGIAALEAMAAGLPVVASDVGGLGEVVAPGTGLLVPPGDVAGLEAALRHLVDERSERVAMGIAGSQVAERWRLERTVTAYADLYTELTGS